MKEIKSEILKLRVTASEKEAIKEYAEAHDMTLSELIRKAIIRYVAIEKGEK